MPNYNCPVKGEKLPIMSQPLHFFGPLPELDKGAEQVFDYSRMSGRYFLPDERICLIFDNSEYSELDLPQCREQAQQFEERIAHFSFRPDQIHRYSDIHHNDFKTAFQETKDKITNNTQQGRRTLLVCFYAGQGIIKITTSALCNTSQS